MSSINSLNHPICINCYKPTFLGSNYCSNKCRFGLVPNRKNCVIPCMIRNCSICNKRTDTQ